MSTLTQPVFILIHGAWHGGWVWQTVAQTLRQQGYTVYTPTLTGLGERAHLLSDTITLDTFISDIINLIKWENLDNIILLGHSFGGTVITGVAEKIPDKIRQLVYLDGFILENGISTFDTLPENTVQKLKNSALTHCNGLALPAPSPKLLGYPNEQTVTEHITGLLTPHPIGTYASALSLHHPVGNYLPVTYIECNNPPYAPVDASKEFARKQPGWIIEKLDASHAAPYTHPQELVDLLVSV